ncbi:SLC2A4 regulator isoform X4 [Oryctolagus cuniculus]|uniref:SLC2A4 regulator isoform X4 n=1 Tax=Oryctolagus cuniculus TaxID=9986 RepID=UPI00387918F8
MWVLLGQGQGLPCAKSTRARCKRATTWAPSLLPPGPLHTRGALGGIACCRRRVRRLPAGPRDHLMLVVEVVSARLSLGPGRARWGTTRLPCQADWSPSPLRQSHPAGTSRPTEMSAEGMPGGLGTPPPSPARTSCARTSHRQPPLPSSPSSYLQCAAGPAASLVLQARAQLHQLSMPAAGGQDRLTPRSCRGPGRVGPTGSGGPPGLQGLQAHGETQADRPGARQPLSGAWLDLGLDSGPWKPCMSTRETRPRVPEAPAPPPPEGGSGHLRGGSHLFVPPQALQDLTPPRAPQHVHPPLTPQGPDSRAASLVLINRIYQEHETRAPPVLPFVEASETPFRPRGCGGGGLRGLESNPPGSWCPGNAAPSWPWPRRERAGISPRSWGRGRAGAGAGLGAEPGQRGSGPVGGGVQSGPMGARRGPPRDVGAARGPMGARGRSVRGGGGLGGVARVAARSGAGVGGPASPAWPGPRPRLGHRRCSVGSRPAMEAERRSAPGSGCGRPQSGAEGPDPDALRAQAPPTVPAPPQGPCVGGGSAGPEFALPQEPGAAGLGAPGPWAGAASARIPVPAQRPEEVVAAAALTSLCSGPLPLAAPACSHSPEPGWEPWREALARPPGSGDGGWDLSREQPPLFPEAAHFLFGEPAMRKRKSSVRVLFQCLWKSCGTVLGTAPAMQRHIRLVHLGSRQAEPEQSDGEEDFYYTELDVGVDVLADGLSSLASVPPTLLRPELPPPVLTAAAPSQAGRSDPAHQGCLAPPEVRTCVPALPCQLSASLRRPRGDAKKCRKVYGMERRELWCTACRWKKACQRFLD